MELLKFTRSALARMETPVIYFYTDTARTVSVDVRMPTGALTEFYPPVTTMEPPYTDFSKERIADGRLVWSKVDLIPTSSASPTDTPPPVKDGAHYGAARATDAALVRFDTPSGRHYEKFLFYRGLADFQPLATVTAKGADTFTLRAASGEPIDHAFVLSIDHGKVRFSEYSSVESSLEMTLSPKTATVDQVADAMAKALEGAGLFAKEARAMVNTWRTSWFSEDGVRVLYVFRNAWVDAVLPLSIEPKPAQTVRVFVGRVEVFTPEAQTKLEAELASLDARGRDSAWNQPVMKSLGRFSGAALNRVADAPMSPAAGAAARAILNR